MSTERFIEDARTLVDQRAIDYLNDLTLSSRLKESMLYSYEAGGKRIRPLLLLSVLKLFNVELAFGMNTAVALEFIHTSSLIHDDLPAMDDDDYRRGQLSNHRQFDEATAILAGDALLLNAFHLIASDKRLSPTKRARITERLAALSGADGMVGGQMLDVENDQLGTRLSLNELETIVLNKTGRLIEFALVAGGIISGAKRAEEKALSEAARHIGIAFQIKDDILDVIGEEGKLGKKIKSDERNKKETFVSLLGLPKAKALLKDHYMNAREALASLPGNASDLEWIFQLMIERDH